MKNLVKKAVKTIAGMAIGFGIGLGIGIGASTEVVVEQIAPVATAQAEVVTEKITVDLVHTQEEEGTFTYDGFDYHLNANETLIVLSDDSWALHHQETGTYVFQPVMLGDWDVEVRDAEQLENIIKTYLNMNNFGWF